MSPVSLVRLSEEFECYAPTDPSGEFFELRFIYSEVFGDAYRNDILNIPDDGVVLDVGANVGLFTLLVKAHSPHATVLAFEPIPNTIEALQRNMGLHRLTDVTVYPLALGSEKTTAQFTYYPQAPGNSTRYPQSKKYRMPQLDISTKVWANVTTAGAVLAQHADLPVIDLVKIDVEGAETEVLAGLQDADWRRIRAFVLEVDDTDGCLQHIRTLLEEKGFVVTVNHAPLTPVEVGLYIVHARRNLYSR